MRNGLLAKLMLGCAAIFACGGMAGVGLANYAASGSFEFYRQASATAWQSEPPPQSVSLASTDPAFASDHRYAPGDGGADAELASLNP